MVNPASSPDSIQIISPNHTSRSIAFKPGGMTLGRDADNDIVLDDGLASRRHARIDFDGQAYRVLDLNSTNGTFLGDKRLAPGVPELWTPDVALRIGDTWLRLERGGAASATAVQPLPQVAQAEAPNAFSSDLTPQTLRSGQTGLVRVRNQGKAAETYTITWRDRANVLQFQPPQARLQVPPGQIGGAEFRAAPKTPRLIGGSETHEFTASVSSEHGGAQAHKGELISSATIPVWVLPVFVVVCLLIVAIAGLAFAGLWRGKSSQQAALTAAGATSLAATSQVAQQTLAAENANSATATALAGTALALGDDDGDGLSNSQEISLGTLPNNPDTDADGLLDGVEVNVHGTDPKNQDSDGDALSDGKEIDPHKTSPKNPDTDGDSVNDGAEVANGTNPLDPDSDHDGLPDGSDPAPLHTSTPTSDLNATAQAAAQKTSAAATAIAQAATNAAATAVAQAATNAAATAQMAATLTAQAQSKIVFIYKTDLALANTYKNLLQSNGYLVDLVQQGSVAGVNYASYRLVIIGPDTGNPATWTTGPWGDPAGSEAGYIDSANKPILGLGRGGALFFAARNLYIDYGNSWSSGAGDTEVHAENASHRIWTTPNAISVPGSGMVKLFNNPSSFVAVYLPGPISGVTAYGRQASDPDHFTIIGEGSRYILWGYASGPGDMNNTGKKVFMNTVNTLVNPLFFMPPGVITTLFPLVTP